MTSIAILIPTYEPKDYLIECLSSIERQSLSKDQYCIYIALNGPKDPYEAFIKELLTNFSFRYKYIYTPKKGVSNARNILIDISTEPYITFIDDDDIVSKNYLEELFNNATPQFMSVSNVKSFQKHIEEAKPNYIGKKFKRLNNNETSKLRSRQYYSSPVAKMLHRKMIGNIKFDTSLSKGEDALFMTEISKNIAGINKTKPSAIYFVNERIGSASRKKTNPLYEVKRITYLTFKYSKMLAHTDKLFIVSRIVATLRHLKNI